MDINRVLSLPVYCNLRLSFYSLVFHELLELSIRSSQSWEESCHISIVDHVFYCMVHIVINKCLALG